MGIIARGSLIVTPRKKEKMGKKAAEVRSWRHRYPRGRCWLSKSLQFWSPWRVLFVGERMWCLTRVFPLRERACVYTHTHRKSHTRFAFVRSRG